MPEPWPAYTQGEEPGPDAAEPGPDASEPTAPGTGAEDTERLRPAPRRQPVDPSVLAILREEAERESAARQTAAEPEPAPDPDAEHTPEPEETPSPRTQDAAETPGDEAATTRPAPVPQRPVDRRSVLPDIEEINSTLRTKGGRRARNTEISYDEVTANALERRNAGFRFGFAFAFVFFTAIAFIYLFPERVVELLPASAPAVETLVEWVTVARIWWDGTVGEAARMLAATLRDLAGA
jgi:hypothetical protein